MNPKGQDIKPNRDNKNLCDGIGCSKEATTEMEVNVGELGVIKLNLCENCKPKFKQFIIKENRMSVCKSG